MTYASSYDLRVFTASILNQGSLGTCAENAESCDVSIIAREIGSTYTPISRLQSYIDYRTMVNKISVDSGTSVEYMLKNAQGIGLAKETSWAYDVSQFTVTPPASVYAEAAQHKITGYTNIGDAAESMRQADIVTLVKSELAQGKPIILGISLKTWFDNETSQHDITQMNPVNYVEDEGRGGHAVTIVGCGDSLCGGKGGYIVQNSWGSDVGDHGDFVIPYSEFPFTYDPSKGYTNTWDDSTNSFNMISMHVINGFEGKDQTWSAERINAEQMYVSDLGRGADIGGLNYWAGLLKSGAATKAAMADGIILSSEYTAAHAGETVSQKIDDYYVGTLGRHADAGGLAFWLDSVTNHGVTLGTVFSQISDQVYSQQTGVDHDFYSNKINVAMTYSVTYQETYHSDIIKAALSHVTADVNYTEVIKIGMAHDLGII